MNDQAQVSAHNGLFLSCLIDDENQKGGSVTEESIRKITTIYFTVIDTKQLLETLQWDHNKDVTRKRKQKKKKLPIHHLL